MAAIIEPAELSPGRLPIIPDPPKRGAVRSLQKALSSRAPADGPELGLTEDAAWAIAYAVADPATTRTYALKHLSYMRVPGGTLTVIRDQLLVNRVITYPVNPRVLDTETFPASEGQPASAPRLFWPERDLVSDPDRHCGLLLRGSTRLRVSRVLQDHAKRLRHQNRLDTIAKLGVLRPIIVMPMVVQTDEEEEPDRRAVTVLTSVEGSSRTAWSHLAQDLDGAAPLYGATADPAAAQAVARQLGEIRTAPRSAVTAKDLERARTLLIPAEIIVGFTPDEEGATPASVVDQLLGLTHIDPPEPWSDQATESKIGDKILAELRDTGHITGDEQEWLAGMVTREEAKGRGIDPWLARRAARLWLVSREPDDNVSRAVSRGIRNASLQRRVRRESKATAAAALALRALPAGALDAQRPIRAALPRAMRMPAFYVSGAAGNGGWTVTNRSADELRDTAINEIGREKTGPATLELCALACWALVSRGKLSRGTAIGRAGGGDPRDPEQILAALMTTELGLRVMHRAVVDDRDGIEPREIDVDTFSPVPTADGSWRAAQETWIRRTVVPRPGADNNDGKGTNKEATEQDILTPQRRLDLALVALDTHVRRLRVLLNELAQIQEDGGQSIIEREGIDDERGNPLVSALVAALSTIHAHRATFNGRYGSAADDETDSGTTGS